jgi:capsid protein
MNLIDRTIAAISPSWALQRQRARNALAFYNGWSGASLTRPALAGWRPAATDADADLSVDLPMLRSRSQDLYRNAPLAGAAINSMATHVVGTGLSLQPAIDIEGLGWTEDKAEQWKKVLMRRWRLWAESTDCDITRTLNFYLLQDLAFRSMLLSGDAFGLVTGTTIDGRELIAIQLIEADRICNRDNEGDSAQLVAGVQMDRYGAPVAYHICRSHPGHEHRPSGRPNGT